MVTAESVVILTGGLISGVVAGWVLNMSRDFAEICKKKGISHGVYRIIEILFSMLVVLIFVLFMIFMID